jgi:hypothetical protein
LTTLRDAYDQLIRLLPEVEPFRGPPCVLAAAGDARRPSRRVAPHHRCGRPGAARLRARKYWSRVVRLRYALGASGEPFRAERPGDGKRRALDHSAMVDPLPRSSDAPGGASTGSCPRADVTRPPAIDRD